MITSLRSWKFRRSLPSDIHSSVIQFPGRIICARTRARATLQIAIAAPRPGATSPKSLVTLSPPDQMDRVPLLSPPHPHAGSDLPARCRGRLRPDYTTSFRLHFRSFFYEPGYSEQQFYLYSAVRIRTQPPSPASLAPSHWQGSSPSFRELPYPRRVSSLLPSCPSAERSGASAYLRSRYRSLIVCLLRSYLILYHILCTSYRIFIFLAAMRDE